MHVSKSTLRMYTGNEGQLHSFDKEKQIESESSLSEMGDKCTYSPFAHSETRDFGKQTRLWSSNAKTSSLDHSNAEVKTETTDETPWQNNDEKEPIQIIKTEIPDTYYWHRSSEDKQMDCELEKPVIGISQEALTNEIKHSGPASFRQNMNEEEQVHGKTEIYDNVYTHQETGFADEVEQYMCNIGQEELNKAISQKKPKFQNGKSSSSNAEERPHACQFCDKRFHKTTGLAVHMHTHTGERPYKCETCGKSFAQPCTLRTHKFIHTEEKSHTCEICLKAFRLPNQLKRHMATHSDKKPFSCEICNKQFNDRSNRSLHMRMQHSTESLFSCDQCDKEFRYACNLKTHKLTHTGEKPYTCNLCSKQYTRSCSYNMHMLTHTGERPFSCKNCEKTFRFKSNLNMHLSRCNNKQL